MVMRIVVFVVLACGACVAVSGESAWKPSRHVELITGGGAGGSQDVVVRSITALLGGHIDLLVFTAGPVIPYIQAGKLRMVAITAPKRATGAFADVPTWKEQGHDVVYDAWRMMLGPRGMSAQQVAFWDQTFERVVQDAAWKKELEMNLWEPDFRRSREAKAYLDAEYSEMKELLVALGMIKR